MTNKIKDFQLPAALGRARLKPFGRSYSDLRVKAETIGNAAAVYAILDKVPKPENAPDFEVCFQRLMRLAALNDPAGFAKKYDKYSRNISFGLRLMARLKHQKVRFLHETVEPTLWTVITTADIYLNPLDPVVDIREDSSCREHGLFLFDVMKRLVNFQPEPVKKI